MGEKTTIEIDNIRELKQHALDTNKTLKQLINEAIEEKIQRERAQLQKRGYRPVTTSEPKPIMPEIIPEDVEKPEEFECEECGKVCGNKPGLISHQKTHVPD